MNSQNLFRRLMTRTFRSRMAAPIRKPLGRAMEPLEDRITPAVTFAFVAGTLSVSSTFNDTLLVSRIGLDAGVNGIDTGIPVAIISSLSINPNAGDGPGDNLIDLSGVLRGATSFPALTAETVNGGGGNDTFVLAGVAGSLDDLRYTPTAAGAGTLINDSEPLPNATFSGIEQLSLTVQQADGDSVRVDGTPGNDTIEFFHGLAASNGTFSGTLDQNNATGNGPFTMTPMTFFGVSPVANDIDINFFSNPGGIDSLIYNGTSSDDTITVQTAQAGGTEFRNTLNGVVVSRLEVFNIASSVVRGLEGNDSVTLNLPAGPAATTVRVEGGDGTNVLNYNAPTGSATAINLGASSITTTAPAGNPVSFSGFATVNETSSGGASTLTVTGTASGDNIGYSPTGATAGMVTVDGQPVINFTGVGGAFTVDGAGGSDAVTLFGTAASDTINVFRSGATVGVQIPGLKTLTVPIANTEALRVFGGQGDDQLNVNAGAAVGSDVIPIPLTFDGEAGSDLLDVFGAPPTVVTGTTYTPGPDNGRARLLYSDAGSASLMTIDAVNIEPVITLVPTATLTVNGTDGDNAINYSPVQIIGAGGRVAIDGLESLEFSNATSLVIDAAGGSDTILLNNSTIPAGLTGITIDGGTGADTVVLQGTTAFETFEYQPAGLTSGTLLYTVGAVARPSAAFSATEAVHIDTGGSIVANADILRYTTPAGADTLTYTPGDGSNAGTIAGTTFAPLSFSQLGTTSSVSFLSAGGREDALEINDAVGTSDVWTVNGAGDAVQVANLAGGFITLPLSTGGIANLELHGLGGGDRFNVSGVLPYTSTIIDDGAAVNLSGASGPVTVFLGDNTPNSPNPNTVVTGYGGSVTLIDIETANLDANNNQVTATGTTQNDNITYTPTGAAAGTFFDNIPSGNNQVPNTVFNIANAAGNFRVFNDPSGSADRVTLQGSAARDLIQINQGSGIAQILANNVIPLLPVQLGISAEILTVLGLGGQNTFQVIPAPGIGGQAQDNLLINIDGGTTATDNGLAIASSFGAAPGQLAANQFVVVNKSPIADSGTVRVFTNAIANPDINYQNVQFVAPNASGTGLSTNLLVMGADGNEPNEQLGNAAFLGAAATATIQHATIFANSTEFPGAPADQDFYRVVANRTGTLDLQVYFRTFNAALLPGGGQLQLQAFDQTGALIANPAAGVSSLQIPVIAGQSYYLRVAGAAANVINGYDATVTVTPAAPLAPNLSVTSPVAGNEATPIPFTITASLNDPTQTLRVSITGFPSGTVFSTGINNGVTVELTAAQLVGLTATFPDGAVGGTVFNLQVTATATNPDGTSATTPMVPTTNLVVTVNNVAPTGSLNGPGTVTEGSTTALVGYSAILGTQFDLSPVDLQTGLRFAYDFDNNGVFDLGDGTFAGSTAQSQVMIPASLLTDGPAVRTVRARIIDKDGGFTDSTVDVTVTNVAPTAAFNVVTAKPIERAPVTVGFSNPSDPSQPDTAAGFTYAFDLNNDGTFEITGATPTASFTPPVEGSYPVQGKITDKDGGSTTYNLTVNAANVDIFAVGAGKGGGPLVKVLNPDGTQKTQFFAYETVFRGGVTVAVGDINGDHIPDIITGTGIGGGPRVEAFDGVTGLLVVNFFAYEDTFRGGVNVTTGDLDGDGTAEIITGPALGGGPRVRGFKVTGNTVAVVSDFFAYAPTFKGGVTVAAGDLDGDKKAEIVTGPGTGGGPHVKTFTAGGVTISSFFAYDPTFTGGVFVATGDRNGDSKAEIITGTGTGKTTVNVFSPAGSLQQSYVAFDPNDVGNPLIRSGVRVAAHDLDGDGKDGIIAGTGPGTASEVDVARTTAPSSNSFFGPFNPFPGPFTGGVFVG